MSRRIPVLLVCAAILFIVTCSQRSALPDSITIAHEISPQPARVGAATFTFKLADAGGKPVTHAKIAVEADMTHAGMSPVFADAVEAQPGRYQAALNFQMAGDWILLLHITLPGGNKLERQIDVRGVRPN